MVRCITCNVFHMRQLCRFFYCLAWFDTVESPAVSKQQYVRWCAFRWEIPLSIYYVWNWCIDRAISTTSCSYCIWNRYHQNHRCTLQNFQFFASFDTIEFNRLPWSNNKIIDDAVFADRFRYQLTMFGFRELIGISRLIHTHIAYEIDTAKMIAAFFRISYCFHYLIRLNSIVCHFQTTKCTMMRFSLIGSAINCLMFEVCILIGLSRILDTYIAYKYLYKTWPLITGLMRLTISHSELQWIASLDVDNRYMDGRRECEDITDIRNILDIYIYYLSNVLIFLFNNVHYSIV